MTKKELLKELERFDDDDVVIITDRKDHSYATYINIFKQHEPYFGNDIVAEDKYHLGVDLEHNSLGYKVNFIEFKYE